MSAPAPPSAVMVSSHVSTGIAKVRSKEGVCIVKSRSCCESEVGKVAGKVDGAVLRVAVGAVLRVVVGAELWEVVGAVVREIGGPVVRAIVDALDGIDGSPFGCFLGTFFGAFFGSFLSKSFSLPPSALREPDLP